MANKSFKKLIEDAKKRDTFWTATLILEFTEGLQNLMGKSGISRIELAKRLGVSPAYVTKVMRGNVNFTVDSMVKLANAVGGRVHVHVAPESHQVRWFDVIEKNPRRTPVWEQDKFEPASRPFKMEVTSDESAIAA